MPELVKLDAAAIGARSGPLARLLIDAVHHGAGIGFLPPVTQEAALAYWRDVQADVAQGGRVLLALVEGDDVVGCVQLAPARLATGVHRAEVHKLMVHTSRRREGHATRLMEAAEEAARAMGRPLLVLDTFVGSDGERLYRKLGWREVGVIPQYAIRPDGELGDLVLFWKWVE